MSRRLLAAGYHHHGNSAFANQHPVGPLKLPDPGLNSDLMELSIQLVDRYEIYPLPGLLPQERVGMHGFTNNPDLTGPPYIISIIYPSALINNKF